jgi:circadian clock protein KaiC
LHCGIYTFGYGLNIENRRRLIPSINLDTRIAPVLEKSQTGIKGLDEITFGGIPKGRTTLICGSAGCGKTMIGMQFIVHGAVQLSEPGIYIAFEETDEELRVNFASLGIDLGKLERDKKVIVDFVYIERSEFEETGEYDLEGLFIRLGSAIDSIGAKRIVLDTVEALFSGFSNQSILRAELRRLFRWLKTKGVTAIVTGERGEETLTRYGLEEYVADCVIQLDHRVTEQISTRRIKVIKYRGSVHGTNEYPFLIDESGINVIPITSLGLDYAVSSKRISSGIDGLDEMLGNEGYYRGSIVLVSGTAGTGKTSVAAHFVNSACSRGERALYLAFEESESQVVRNMANIGIKFGQWSEKGLIRFSANRPTLYGLEMHLTTIHKLIEEYKPLVMVIDPISNLITSGSMVQAKSMLARLLDFLKMNGITILMTDLCSADSSNADTDIGISSLTDTWISLENKNEDTERNRYINILKSRGMNHSNQIRKFLITKNGFDFTVG